jgi:hypothetical protein
MWPLGTLNVFPCCVIVACLTSSLQVTRRLYKCSFKAEKAMQIPECQNPYCVEVVQRFPTEILQQFPSLCVECFRKLSWRRITQSPRLEDREIFFWKYFASFTVWQGICASTSSTLDDPEKLVARILPEIGVT